MAARAVRRRRVDGCALGSLPLMYQPGERWLYNSSAQVLGVLVARAAGKDVETVLRERIFEPLGMPDTGFGAEPRPGARNRSPGGPAAQSPAAYTGPQTAKSMRGCGATEKTRVAFTDAGSAASSSSNAGERSSASEGFMYMSLLHVLCQP